MARINYAISGFGKHGARHSLETKWIPALKKRCQFIAAYDPDEKVLEKIQKANGIDVDTFDDLLSMAQWDAIIVASPPEHHAAQVIAALESGLHVYSEVPMALTNNDVEKIIAAEDASGKCYQLGENYCFFPEVLFAGEMSSGGKFGKIVKVECEFLIDETRKAWLYNPTAKLSNIMPKKISWFQEIYPLMYGHSIGPAQVAIGGIDAPVTFKEVVACSNNIGDRDDAPFIFERTDSFHEALFYTDAGAIAQCANAFIYHWKHSNKVLRVIGKKGEYWTNKIGGHGRLRSLLMDNEGTTNKIKYKSRRIGQMSLWKRIKPVLGNYHGANTRIKINWFDAINTGIKPSLHARVGGNMTSAGIAARKATKSRSSVKIASFD